MKNMKNLMSTIFALCLAIEGGIFATGSHSMVAMCAIIMAAYIVPLAIIMWRNSRG